MFRKHFNAGTVVAIVALVFAMTGGAFAVTSKGNSQGPVASVAKKKKAKVLRGTRGPKGATGATGPAGAVGAQGPAGPAGPAGPKGENGAPGAKGETGAVGPQGPQGSQGAKGAAGAAGAQGLQGEPWTAGGTLPKGKSEMGAWIAPALEFLQVEGKAAISFGIPLTTALVDENQCGAPGKEPCHIQVKEEGYDGTDHTGAEHEQCPGTAAEPKAKEGFLCVYTEASGAMTPASPVAYFSSVAGAVIYFGSGAAAGINAFGTWAVTAS